MTNGLSDVIGRLRVTLARDPLEEVADRDLLMKFVVDRDEAVFAELVRRHGPTVLAECRRVLFDRSACDDVFQATFLVLARRAGSIRDPSRLGGWLKGVAGKIARRIRRQALRRAEVERPLAGDDAASAETKPSAADLCGVLAEELARLPRHYREAVTACDVDGLSRPDRPQGRHVHPLRRRRRRREELEGAVCGRVQGRCGPPGRGAHK
jgi:DNA-directed RNA polymerase specialized sigma24 family protein